MGNAFYQQTTYFAPAERANRATIQEQIVALSRNPIVDTLLQSVGGLLAILNEHRQILAVNEVLLQAFDIDSARLGLRPGEALGCTHSDEGPGGCGTGPACVTCGAAIALMACLESDQPSQQECFVTLERDGKPVDFYFQVRCSPLILENSRYLLFFLQDITEQQKYAMLERAFFHDVKNLVSSLLLSTHMMESQLDPPSIQQLIDRQKETVARLGTEIEIQRVLCDNRTTEYQVQRRSLAVSDVIAALEDVFPAADVPLRFEPVPPGDITLYTDVNLLQRVLTNMVLNAIEASRGGDMVRVWVESDGDNVTFCVWNRAAIPPENVPRIFQRNFSTKGGSGRGLGTYAMKLFGETYLGGAVSFASSGPDGTTFRLALPVFGT